MKQLQMTLLAFLGCIMFSFAQQKAVEKVVISTPTVQCDMCKDKIEKYMFKQYGINSVKVDVKKKTTTVVYITDRTNVENIKTSIANAGFDADDVTAEETAYNRLPACCKKPEPAKPAAVTGN